MLQFVLITVQSVMQGQLDFVFLVALANWWRISLKTMMAVKCYAMAKKKPDILRQLRALTETLGLSATCMYVLYTSMNLFVYTQNVFLNHMARETSGYLSVTYMFTLYIEFLSQMKSTSSPCTYVRIKCRDKLWGTCLPHVFLLLSNSIFIESVSSMHFRAMCTMYFTEIQTTNVISEFCGIS